MEDSDKKNQLSKETVQQFIEAMDSEYDKKVVKACFAILLSRTEMEKGGIKPDIATRALKEGSVIANEVEGSYIAGDDILKLRIKEQINKLDEKIEQVTKCIAKTNITQSNGTVKQDYLEQKDNKMKTKFKFSAKRIGLDLINKNILKHRKHKGGAK